MMISRRTIGLAVSAGMVSVLLAGCASGDSPSADPGSVELRAVATQKSGHTWKVWEWLQSEVEARTDGAVEISLSELAELGLDGTNIIATLDDGLIDVADVVAGYVGGAQPFVEGPQLPGLYDTFDESRAIWGDWSSVLKEQQSRLGGTYIGEYPWECVSVYSADPIESLDDLKGMKIRVLGTGQADYFRALGAEPVTLPFGEMYSALQRGVVDAVVSSPSVGQSLSLAEVVNYSTDLKLGCTGGMAVVNDDVLASLTEEQQAVFTEIGEEFSEFGWDTAQTATTAAREEAEADGITFVALSPEWDEQLTRVAKEVVVPAWVSRAGPEFGAVFNEVIAPYVGWEYEG